MLSINKKLKYILSLFICLPLLMTNTAWAAGPPSESPFSNPLALTLIVLMLLLLIIIGILANILLGTADIKLKKRRTESAKAMSAVIILVLLTLSPSVFAQDGNAEATTQAVTQTIGGMSASTFYIMAAVIFLELFIIIALLINIKFLLRTEKAKLAITETEEQVEAKKNKLSWWDRFNKLKPVSEEAELDLGHEYDGIRELNNRLPPWWLYGFYASILFAVIYLWRFHVTHNGPSSKQEYDRSVAKAELRLQEYLKKKGDAVDENTVTILTAPEDISAGKAIFVKSCAVCHKQTGAGDVGPNLTDDYWLHGNDIKSVFKVIRYGVNAMPQWQNQYSNKQIAQVASYVKSLHGSNPPNPKAPDGILQQEEETPPAATDSTATDNKMVMN
ncbi:MAG TPA: cbb3-type cytochrome c oxidase N-terminal domain-containing protein [Chitinophagaceae bacterium]|nr:c-type cytochrome [Chitinophagaceae bacterium]HRX93833.1 cbb3-type cytochrome c oxidase N-terminal domain-containing protein [Chitinophagaceae bacterium]